MLILSTAKKVKQISKCYNIDSRDYLNIDSRDSKNMENKNQESEKMITLKEAAKISGYAPDYVGQLIRKGKLQQKLRTVSGLLKHNFSFNCRPPGFSSRFYMSRCLFQSAFLFCFFIFFQ